MCPANHEKRKKTNNERNRSTKSRKNQNVLRKGNLQILWNIGSGHEKPNSIAEISTKGLTPGLSPCKILVTILEGRTSTNRPENKKTNHDA